MILHVSEPCKFGLSMICKFSFDLTYTHQYLLWGDKHDIVDF